MGQRLKKINNKNIDSLLEKALNNIETDRAQAQTALFPLLEHLQGQVERNEKMGIIAAKYLETLQRSNEQLVKIIEITRKKQIGDSSAELSHDDKESILDEIQTEALEKEE